MCLLRSRPPSRPGNRPLLRSGNLSRLRPDRVTVSDAELRARIMAMSPEARRDLFDTASPAELEVLERVTRPPDAGAARWLYDPAGFVRDGIVWQPGKEPAGYELEILDDLVEHRRVAVRGPHGLGKTTTASWAMHWFALSREAAQVDWKIVSTASVYRQLREYLWPEVHKWAKRLNPGTVDPDVLVADRTLLNMAVRLDYGSAFAASPSDHEKIEGAHADHILYVFDEAKMIPDDVWDAAEGALAADGVDGKEAYALAISTPGEPAGRFYSIHDGRAGLEDWHVNHVTLGQAIDAGRISRRWASNRRRQWGATSALYLNRVEGEFASSSSDGTIPLRWIEAANERWHQLAGDFGPRTDVGVDVARTGLDDTTFAIYHADRDAVSKVRAKHGIMTTETTEIARGYGKPDGAGPARLVVDVIGIGAGVVDQLRKARERVVAFNASASTDRTDSSGELTFVNTRSAAWWHVRELLDPDRPAGATLALPPDDDLTGELAAPTWRVKNRRIAVEGKDEIRKRIGRSTDKADAVIQALWPEGTSGPVKVSSAKGRIPSGIG